MAGFELKKHEGDVPPMPFGVTTSAPFNYYVPDGQNHDTQDKLTVLALIGAYDHVSGAYNASSTIILSHEGEDSEFDFDITGITTVPELQSDLTSQVYDEKKRLQEVCIEKKIERANAYASIKKHALGWGALLLSGISALVLDKNGIVIDMDEKVDFLSRLLVVFSAAGGVTGTSLNVFVVTDKTLEIEDNNKSIDKLEKIHNKLTTFSLTDDNEN